MNRPSKIRNPITQLTLETLDNPGWDLRIERQSKGLESECRRSFINDSDWFIKTITPEAISLSGDAKKLLYCCQEALGLLGISLSEELLNDYKAALLFLQDWYSKQCDGDWEHHYGVTIHMDANGLCRCVIDLEDTFGADGKVSQIVGNDGIVRTKLEISGSYKGRDGNFEYIIEPNKTINHRFFKPSK